MIGPRWFDLMDCHAYVLRDDGHLAGSNRSEGVPTLPTSLPFRAKGYPLPISPYLLPYLNVLIWRWQARRPPAKSRSDLNDSPSPQGQIDRACTSITRLFSMQQMGPRGRARASRRATAVGGHGQDLTHATKGNAMRHDDTCRPYA